MNIKEINIAKCESYSKFELGTIDYGHCTYIFNEVSRSAYLRLYATVRGESFDDNATVDDMPVFKLRICLLEVTRIDDKGSSKTLEFITGLHHNSVRDAFYYIRKHQIGLYDIESALENRKSYNGFEWVDMPIPNPTDFDDRLKTEVRVYVRRKHKYLKPFIFQKDSIHIVKCGQITDMIEEALNQVASTK